MIFSVAGLLCLWFACCLYDANAERPKVHCTYPLYNPATSEGTLMLVELQSDLLVAAQLVLLYLYV